MNDTNVLVLCKNKYMGKDVYADRYGRLYMLPFASSLYCFKVRLVCLDYSIRQLFCCKLSQINPRLCVRVYGLGLLPLYLVRVILLGRSKSFFLASSDCFHVILSWLLAKLCAAEFVVDLYDNYESFGMANLPFVRRLYRRALKEASAIACVSEPLAEHIRDQLRCNKGGSVPVVVIESTISKGAFMPKDKHVCRKKLSLPHEKPLIGYAGALDSSRDIEVLYRAFAEVKKCEPSAALVLAGLADGSCPIPQGYDVRYLGNLSHEDVVDFYGALDVGVICVKDSEFGRYAFPQKAYEMISMSIPLAVTNVGAMGRLFDNYPEVLYPPGDCEGLARVILRQLANPELVDMPIPTWDDQAKKMKVLLESIAGDKAMQRDLNR